MVNFTISKNAYAKVAFHAAKYPHRQVNGILLGKQISGSVQVEDTIPLLHHWTSLSPSMEIGLDLVSSFFTSDSWILTRLMTGHCWEARNYAHSVGLEVVAYYQSSDYPNDVALVPVGEKVAETIRKHFENVVAFVVCAASL